ncbi:LacI family transcriptional regulator [Roseibium aquae]|uniref:LacI family transcriptional regulator n=1 Tax=Roseibium aquae TaxID=1323746 RepID=A0A916TKH3_9HYPH|nr:substrate-binding domain-containing protein [Roseibium aquae]GGB45572.1 LacI family transcriptional regulator [Roseibium aquae]
MNLKELAASLGLSQTTVSRALNGYPEVREETRLRVEAAAKAAGYQPNARARRLATGRAMTIGHVIPLSGESDMVNPIFSDFLAGAGEVYAREGYDLLLSIVAESEVERAFRQMAANGSVDGVMIQGPKREDPRIPLVQTLGLPFLVHGRTGDYDSYSWLDIANFRAFKRASEFLLDLGHTRIALINGLETMDFAIRRRKGYETALQDRGIAPDPAFMRSDTMTEGYGYLAAADMLARSALRPTAFLVSSVMSAMGVRRAIGDAGLRLGKDVSLITHDDVLSYLNNDRDGPAFTATKSSVRAAGRRCAEILIKIIVSPETGPVQELWEPELTVGYSTGPAPPG